MARILLGLVLTACLLTWGCVASTKNSSRQDARTNYLLGVSALGEGRPTEALQKFMDAAEADPRDSEVQAGLAQAYMQKGAYDLAEKHFLRAIELSDGKPEFYNNLGALYLTTERYDDAVVAFRKAADNLLFPRPEVSWAGVGQALFQKRDYIAAEKAYTKSRSMNPRYFQAYFGLGEVYYAQERMVEAVDAFARSVETAPAFARGHYWLGLACMKTRDNSRARAAFMETIRLAPESDQARLAKGYLKILD